MEDQHFHALKKHKGNWLIEDQKKGISVNVRLGDKFGNLVKYIDKVKNKAK